MKAFQIISDGSCDLPTDLLLLHEIVIVPFSITFESDKENVLYQNKDMTTDQFYDRVLSSPKDFPYTACPSVQCYLDHFEESYSSHTPILCVCISSKWSGSYNSACRAKEMLLEKHSDAVIEVIDSDANTVCQGLYVLEIARLRDKGLSFETICDLCQVEHGERIIFSVSDLSYLLHGGRIGNLAATIARIFPINPLIIAKHGEIYSGGIALKRRRAMLSIIQKVNEHFLKHHLKKEEYVFSVGYCYNRDEGEMFQKEVEKKVGVKTILSQIGMTIAVHTGPEALGVAFIRKFDAPYVRE
ncbi:MAG: DegV family protein [Coprobacillus sp.]|nr:DegV family protein [Coprobacillus sp.]